MSVYIYEDLERISTNYHDGGGVVIVTDGDPNEAWQRRNRAIAANHPSNAAYLDGNEIIQVLPEPTRVVATAPGESEQVVVFVDAGCC